MSLIGSMLSIAADLAGFVADSTSALDRGRLRVTITHPSPNSEIGGRYLTISGECHGRRRSAELWVAIQPSDCRGTDSWWVQGPALNVREDGTWKVAQARLGREGLEAALDVGATFTIGVFAVEPDSKNPFTHSLNGGERFSPPPGSRLLTSVEVRRVRD